MTPSNHVTDPKEHATAVCPHVVTGDDGTAHCDLAERGEQ